MKKTVSTWMLAVLLVATAFVSCSKDGSKPNPNPNPGGGGGGENPPPTTTYSMTMKIDGVQKTFSSVTAAVQDGDGGQILVVDGFTDASQSEINELILGQAGTLKAGEYVEGEHDDYGIAGIYKPADVTEENAFVAGVTLNGAAPFKIKITSITADVVKGTFSGSYYDGSGEGTNKKVITDGQFNVKIQH